MNSVAAFETVSESEHRSVAELADIGSRYPQNHNRGSDLFDREIAMDPVAADFPGFPPIHDGYRMNSTSTRRGTIPASYPRSSSFWAASGTTSPQSTV